MKRFILKSFVVLFISFVIFSAGLATGAYVGYTGNNYIRSYVEDPGSVQKLASATGAFVSTLKSDKKTEKQWVRGWITKITDGDTLKVKTGDGTINVRLYGIDAPESPKKGKSGQPMWDVSTGIIKEQINQMTGEVYIVPINKDRYGRTVGVVYMAKMFEDGSVPTVDWVLENTYSLNELIVLAGGAEVYREYLKNKILLGRFELSEQEAKDNQAGIWSLDEYVRPSEFRKGE